jgi:hypothetical protein
MLVMCIEDSFITMERIGWSMSIRECCKQEVRNVL